MTTILKLSFSFGLVLLFMSYTGNAQEHKLKLANKKYEELAYIEATKYYLEIAESGYKSQELFEKLGNSYYFNANYPKAAKWYRELFELTDTAAPIYYLRYSQSLKSVGNSSESKKWFNKYLDNTNVTGMNYENAEEYLSIIEDMSGRYSMKSLASNTDGIDFGVFPYKEKIIFASSKGNGDVSGSKISKWDGLSYMDLFEATVSEDGTVGNIVGIEGDVNTKFHESNAVITKEGDVMYFTRNNTTPGDKRDKNAIQRLKIYRAHLVNGKWVQVEDLSINGDSFSTAHPMLSTQEDKLYFSSDRPESMGQTDIFVVTINPDGSLGMPANLGPKVNTKGREAFPFITEEGELYFSSDGHYGLGGYDVFYTSLDEKGIPKGNLLNVGEPINSPFDDIAFSIHDHKGYVSSNRQGGMGYDDIYAFTESIPIETAAKKKVYGSVSEADTNKKLEGAIVTILDEKNEVVNQINTNPNGYYEAKLDVDKTYTITVRKQDYEEEEIVTEKGLEDREYNFQLEKIPTDIVTEKVDPTPINFIKIYFDLDRYNIRKDAAMELDKIASIMEQNKGFHLEIKSYTDSRGGNSYNLELSNKRANATIDYLAEKGIDRSRLRGMGEGENNLVNRCRNGVSCSESEHIQNRRSEFKVVEDHL